VHVGKLLKRIRIANEVGRRKELPHCTRAYLNSFDARLAAIQRANRRRKLGDRLVGRSGELRRRNTSEIE
jgi:hypothetical protein